MVKLETSKDRYNAMGDLFHRATNLDNEFHYEATHGGVEFGDVIALLAQVENLSAMDELIRTEMALENTLTDMLNLPCDSEEDRRNFVAAYGKGVHIFLKDILLGRIKVTIDMANPRVAKDKRLVKLQRDIHDTMIKLLDRYKELYKI